MTLILIGRNDADALGAGWHPAQEGPAGAPCRWMSPRAVVRVAGAGAGEICVTVSAPALIQGRRPGLSVYAGEQLLGHCADLGDEGVWNVARILFENPGNNGGAPGSAAEKLEMTLVIEELGGGEPNSLSFIPHEVMGNGDLRDLGALVSSIRLITPD